MKAVILCGGQGTRIRLWNVAQPMPFPAVTTATVRHDAFLAVGGFDARYVYFDTFCWLELLMHYDCAVDTQALTVNRIHGACILPLLHS